MLSLPFVKAVEMRTSDEEVNLDRVGKLVLRAGRESGRGGPQLALNREAMQIIFTLRNRRVGD